MSIQKEQLAIQQPGWTEAELAGVQPAIPFGLFPSGADEQTKIENTQTYQQRQTTIAAELTVSSLYATGVLTTEESESDAVRSNLLNTLAVCSGNLAFVAEPEQARVLFTSAINVVRAQGLSFDQEEKAFRLAGMLVDASDGSLESMKVYGEFLNRWRHIHEAQDESPTARFNMARQGIKILANINGDNNFNQPKQITPEAMYNVLGHVLDAKQVQLRLERNGLTGTSDQILRHIDKDLLENPLAPTVLSRSAHMVEAAASAEVGDDRLLSKLFLVANRYGRNQGLSEGRSVAFLDKVAPVLVDDTSLLRQIISKNSFGSGGNFGIGDFLCHAYTSEWSPEGLCDLLLALEDVPATDARAFRQNREDAILVSDSFEVLRDWIHDHHPGTKRLIASMVRYYDVHKNPDSSDGDKRTSQQGLVEIFEHEDPEYRVQEVFDLDAYEVIGGSDSRNTSRGDDSVMVFNEKREKTIDILRRLETNLEISAKLPQKVSDESLATLITTYDIEPSEHSLLEISDHINETLKRLYESKQVGVEPDFVQVLAWVNFQRARYMRSLKEKPQSEILNNQLFQSVVEGIALTVGDGYDAETVHTMIETVKDDTLPDQVRKRAYFDHILSAVNKTARRYKTINRENWTKALWSGNTIDAVIMLGQKA